MTAGGRVLCVVALGDDVSAAAERAYDLVGRIGWEQVYFRRDIGHRARAREAQRTRRNPSEMTTGGTERAQTESHGDTA